MSSGNRPQSQCRASPELPWGLWAGHLTPLQTPGVPEGLQTAEDSTASHWSAARPLSAHLAHPAWAASSTCPHRRLHL